MNESVNVVERLEEIEKTKWGRTIRRERIKESIRDQPKNKNVSKHVYWCRLSRWIVIFFYIYIYIYINEIETKGRTLEKMRDRNREQDSENFWYVPSLLDLAQFRERKENVSKICFASHCRQSILVRPRRENKQRGKKQKQQMAPGCVPVNRRSVPRRTNLHLIIYNIYNFIRYRGHFA